MQDKLLISVKIKKTIDYVNKAINNYHHSYVVLKNNISNCLFNLLELSYRSSLFKDINYMKEILIKIKRIEYYIKISYDYKLISLKKFEI